MLEYAARVMKFHADRKAVLEIEYQEEEGTGLGPTLEFYALVGFVWSLGDCSGTGNLLLF